MRFNENREDIIKSISITIFTLYMLTASLYVAVFNSLKYQILIIGIISGVLILNHFINKGKYFLEKRDIFFILAIVAVMGSLHGFTLDILRFAGPVIISLGIIITFFIRGKIENYDLSFKLIKWFGVLYAFSVMLSYFFPGLYSTLFLSYIRPLFAENILMLMEEGYYTGFTGQVAYTAGYIVNAMGLIICGWILGNKNFNKKDLFLFTILLFGLLLTQKRAHLLFFILTLIIVYLQYSSGSLKVKLEKALKILVFTTIIIVPSVIVLSFTNFGKILFGRIYETYNTLISGQDITSNRIALWEHAWRLFLENPFFGIGWGNFRETVIGNVTVRTEMEAHNIYLQLLSETGIIGTILILTPFLLTYLYTTKMTQMIYENKDQFSFKWRLAVLYSLYIQTFFLLYGFTGNPLYDYSFLIMYFLSFGLIYSFRQYNERKTINIEKVNTVKSFMKTIKKFNFKH